MTVQYSVATAVQVLKTEVLVHYLFAVFVLISPRSLLLHSFLIR